MTRRRQRGPSIFHYENFVKKIDACKYALKESQFYDKLLTLIKRAFEELSIKNISSVLCYGLGNFTYSVISRYQLALLLLLKESFDDVDVHVYDPIFSQTETSFLTQLNLFVIPENETGARKIESSTFIFLPHCPTALINNLLWCNWNPNLRNCIVFGNSFRSLAESQVERDFKTKYRYLHSILPVTTEFQTENVFQCTDIFNDLSLHIFLPHALDNFDKSFWMERTCPEYDETEIECITEKLSKSKINL